jgi:hypothetical protein
MAVAPCRLVNQTEHHPAQPVHGVAAEIIRIVTVAATRQDKLGRNANRSKNPAGRGHISAQGHLGWGDRRGRAPTILAVKHPEGSTEHN